MGPHDFASGEAQESPRVACDDCGFGWFGRTAVHGLSVLGCCPRCGGHLHFREGELAHLDEEDVYVAAGVGASSRDLEPWQVLGPPTSWTSH